MANHHHQRPTALPSPPTTPSHPPPNLHILVIGAGLGGLSAAIGLSLSSPHHRITVVEQASALTEVGAGIQVPPNSSRILIKWGLRDALEKHSVCPRAFVYRRYSDGEVLAGYHGLVDDAHTGGHEQEYGGPYWHIHRADFHRALVDRATELGVEMHLNHTLSDILLPSDGHPVEFPTAIFANGARITADLIIGADGLRSRTRELILRRPDPPHNTGDLAYRILVRKSDMEAYESVHGPVGLTELLKEPQITFWLGPQAHAVCYLLKGESMYNVVLLTPDTLPDHTNIAPADPAEMRGFFANWDPRLRAILEIALEKGVHPIQKWRLQNSRSIPTWRRGGGLVLLGDAAHATLPYLAQGAALAVEDAECLSLLISRLTSREQLPDVLEMYESLRKPRAEEVVKASTEMRGVLHMPDGAEQERRDRVLLGYEDRRRRGLERRQDAGGGFAMRWADGAFRGWLFGGEGEQARRVDEAWGERMMMMMMEGKR